VNHANFHNQLLKLTITGFSVYFNKLYGQRYRTFLPTLGKFFIVAMGVNGSQCRFAKINLISHSINSLDIETMANSIDTKPLCYQSEKHALATN
jgi:hypothetical protein